MGLVTLLTDTLPDSDSRSWSAKSPLKGLCLCSSLDEKLGFDLLQFKLTASAKIGVVPEKFKKNGKAQCHGIILNKIEKTFNKTYTGLKSFLQRFQICFSQNPSCKGMESTS